MNRKMLLVSEQVWLLLWTTTEIVSKEPRCVLDGCALVGVLCHDRHAVQICTDKLHGTSKCGQ